MSTEENKEEEGFQLGDRVYIASTGPIDGLRGRIYYLDENLIRILPDGSFHRLETIPIVNGDFDPALQITNAYVIKKHVSPAFVVQHDFQVGYLAETIKESGEMGPTYKIKAIDEESDTVVLEDTTGKETTIVFGFVGIPQDEDFIIMRVRQPPEAIAENDAKEDAALALLSDEKPVEEEGLEILDTLDVPQVTEIREIFATQRFYPDVVQRNDMLQDLLSALSVKQQKNPQKQTEIRKLVESMILLRNQVVSYAKSGEPTGRINTSYQTLIELLQKGDVALSRRVADIKRVLFFDHTKQHLEGKEADPVDVDPTVVVRYLDEVITASNEYYNTQIGGIQGQAITTALPNWFLSWEAYFSKFHQSWTASGGIPLASDTEFFRQVAPDLDSKELSGIINLQNSDDFTKIPLTVDYIEKIRISVLRGLGPRMAKGRAIESAEAFPTTSYVLFPMKYDRDIGTIRSGRLALDMGKAMMPAMTMTETLFKQPISDIPTSGAIFSVTGASLANITIEDWLVGQPLESKGMGDVMTKLVSFGLASKELSLDQMLVVVEKIDKYRALVRASIQEINSKSRAEMDAIVLQNNPMLLPEVVQERVQQFLGEPAFQKAIQNFQTRYPSYRENDIALFAYLFIELYEFTFAVLSGAPHSLQREIRRKARGDFLRRLYESAALLEKNSKKVLEIIEKPTVPRSHVKEYMDMDVRSVNPCAHVQSINMIRKIKDATLRMKALLEYKTRFTGNKKDNWLYCKVCSKECMCVHELILLQEFLNPKEKEGLHKELLLTFSRNQFHGQFCCSNCGQSISDIDYDTSLEYDDEGRPMSGRAVLVDKDAIFQDQLDQALGAPIGTPEDMQFVSETQTDVYKVTKAVAIRIGVNITEEGYRKIAARVELDLSKQPSREDYVKFQKAKKAKGERTIDYDVLRSRIMVTTTAAYLLVELQTGVPAYKTRYRLPGCTKVGFSGYPVGPKEQTTGVEYISCAIAGINDNIPPWNLTGFLKEKSVAKRQVDIMKLILAAAENVLKNSDVQHDISLKNENKEKDATLLQDDILREAVPSGFVPEQGSHEGAVVVAEAASEKEKGRAWILLANDAAKEGISISGSPYMESACCYHPLQTPTAFWDEKQKSFPTFAKDVPSGGKGSHLAVHYSARTQIQSNVVAPDSILYRVFLQVCFDGVRRGLPHEPGFDNLCPHCGFKFPAAPETLTPEEGLTALQSQNVDTSRDRFQDLLDESHNKYSVKPNKPIELVTGVSLLEKLRALEPAPFDGWKEALANIILAVQTFGEKTEEMDIATAYGPLSNLAEEFKQDLEERLGQENGRTLERLVKQSPAALVQSLQSYFLVPFHRLRSGFHMNSLKVQKSYELGEGTEEDLHTILQNHLAYMDELKKRMNKNTTAKINDMKKKLAAALPLLQEIRTPLLPGGSIGLPYLLQAMVMGMFAECANPNNIPEESGSSSDARMAQQILSICLGRFRAEGMNFTQAEIQSMIAKRDEVEKMRIIGKFDRMSPEEKAAELINKRLGLGQWAVGGTDAVWKYSDAQYERERVERGEMVGLAADAGADVGAEAGYSNEQVGEDDY